ncbi:MULTISPECIES: ABC transporter permease [Nocardiopsis]|uniref:Autoinducer 2 import system permease protein LsrC n=1 Tax=Nocardiopsis alba TaxID=53437 RepID=A0A7K2IR28_9ACTN|nr:MULTISPECIES: ABC transporter permease [Nocardiopsis]MEC3892841.1 ABC transporter permease [Nocardiopsis sp. LDBS1602]MYR32245.1 ABC transporter permease [Nocardiopsis alba]
MTRPTRLSPGALSSALRGGTGTVAVLLTLIFLVIAVQNPSFFEGPPLMAFAKKAAPLVVLALGQYLVIVSGEFDLSVGSLVGAQVVIAARLIDGDEASTLPVIGLMLLFGLVVGLVNGLITTVLRVPSIITTLGTMLILFGAVRYWTGGAPTGALSEGFRVFGRHGLDGVPVIGQLPWALVIAAVLTVGAVLLMRSPYGRSLMATGDNDTAAAFSGVRVRRVRTLAFVGSSLAATVAAILIGGFAGVTAQVGQGLEFTAITAVVLGGVVLGGGRGSVIAAVLGALTVEALFTLFNQLYLPSTIQPAAQGLIIIAAVAYASRRGDRRPPRHARRRPVHPNDRPLDPSRR